MRYYVVSDVHGFYDQLVKSLKKSGYFKDKTPHKLVICGDVFDRGAQSLQMQEFVDSLLKKDEVILIRGNHEDLLVELTDNIYKWFGRGIENTHHWKNGTVGTLLALTGTSLEEAAAKPDAVADKMYNTPFFKSILPKMRDYFETEHYIFVHGWIPCNASGFGGLAFYFSYDKNWREAKKEDWYFARWYNGMKAHSQGAGEPGKTIVCGHWHASFGHCNYENKGSEFEKDAIFTPYYADGIIAIDACTSYSGFVNCVVIED